VLDKELDKHPRSEAEDASGCLVTSYPQQPYPVYNTLKGIRWAGHRR
jgi:hypothetical protein